MDDQQAQNDLASQADVVLEHQRRRRYRLLVIRCQIGLLLLLGLLFMIYLANTTNQLPSTGTLYCIVLPAMILPQLVLFAIWRCSSCGTSLSQRADPQFCPACGAQLRFPDS